MDTNKLSGKLDDKLEVMCDGLAAPILEDQQNSFFEKKTLKLTSLIMSQ